MKKEFVPYELAVKLKALGFDESCVAIFGRNNELSVDDGFYKQENYHKDTILAPTFSQAFRWFRERYALCIVIKPIDHKKLEFGYNLTKNGLIMGAYKTYEKAELACLEKLIELTFKSE